VKNERDIIMKKIHVILWISSIILSSCSSNNYELVSRADAIPPEQIKIRPDQDIYPPILHSDEFEEPVPLPDIINSSGGEDSSFFPCCSSDEFFFFFFTPDVSQSAEKQVIDGATGIYSSTFTNGEWTEPQRVVLQDSNKLSLDGCTFVLDNRIWFCSAREGYEGLHWFTAEYDGEKWENWELVDFDPAYEVGELHITPDMKTMYFHSYREGGLGGLDIWVTEFVNGEWQQPVNFEIMNSNLDEGWPYLSNDGSEFWFNRWYQGTPALFRSKLIDGEWQPPELMISQFAGEPTMDKDGNLYFTHHFYENAVMLEADIYVAKRK
jgi:hypothetical protein